MDAEVEAIAAFIHTNEVPMTVADPQLPDCPIISSDAALQELMGYPHTMIDGKNCRILQVSATDQGERLMVRRVVRGLQSCVASLLNFRASGEIFHNF